MSYYYPLQQYATKKHVAERLLLLREKMKASIPAKTIDQTLLLATWNLREFDSPTYGTRMVDAMYYIAEIINSFDIVAIQEVREDLKALKDLIFLLGPHWDYIVSDVVDGRAGNGERMAFVYDKRKVYFSKMAGELVLTPEKENSNTEQFARTPYLVSFQSGWFKFYLCTVHIYYGKGKPGIERRTKEISKVANFLKKRALAEKKKAYAGDTYNYILLGDFNIISPTDATYKALTQNTGFIMHEGVMKGNLTGSNVNKDKYYDQIAFFKDKGQLEMGSAAGIFDFFEYVYTENDYAYHKPVIAKMLKDKKSITKLTEAYYKKWRTYQMSDHLPMWVELKIDFSTQYLKNIQTAKIEE